MADNRNKKRYNKHSRQYFQQPRKRTWSGKEFGKAGQDILNKYGSFGENPDSVIATKGMDHMDDIERDAHLSSCLATRRQKLIRRGWRIVPASTKRNDVMIADFVKRSLVNMQGSFEKDMEGMLDAVGKGFSLTEINYKMVSWRGRELVGLKNLRYKEPKLFSFKFDELGYFKINQIDPDPSGVELPSEKFIHIIMGPNDENPYGRSVDSEVAFWCWVKKNVAKFWAIFAEKFGMPLSYVTIPNNASDRDISKVDDILSAIQEETGIRVPEGFEVKFLEAMRNADAGYERFIEICNKEISKRVFGATLISEEGKRGQGSYALGQEHSEILEEYVTFDAAVLEAALNESLIKRLVDYNFDVAEYPRFEFIEFSVGIFISFSQAVRNLVLAGLKIPKKWVHERLKIPEAREGEEVLEVAGVTSPGFDLRSNRPPSKGELPGSQANKGLDNRVKMEELIASVEFDEDTKKDILASFRNLDALTERYQRIVAGEYDKFAQLIKKKSSAASVS